MSTVGKKNKCTIVTAVESDTHKSIIHILCLECSEKIDCSLHYIHSMNIDLARSHMA